LPCILHPFFAGYLLLMSQFIEFVGNHWFLSSLWIGLAVAFIVHLSKTGSQGVSAQQAVTLINRTDGRVLDVRDKKDFDAGHIVDAINIPVAKLSTSLGQLEKYKSKPLIVVCKMGQHSGEVCKTLKQAGFDQVVRLSGGMSEWRAQNLPLVQK
jgi:rhodanese-related sulfurtransferase